MRYLASLAMLAALAGNVGYAAESATLRTVDYLRDIKPIFESRCAACHGRWKQKGGLRLDAGAEIHRGGKSGPIISPGHAADSLLFKVLTTTNLDDRMPLAEKPLSERQLVLLRQWINAGAHYPADESIPPPPDKHWAFQPVQKPGLPPVQDSAWPRNALDHFILARLEARGWTPAPPATWPALMRRVYLDLTGLPPPPEEQEAFLASPSPAAFSRLIDDLLARPAYGERWARHWLDLVRYADSNGYERDAAKPFVWRYRDYVIRALNNDKPFDQFVLEQLAGDELPDPDTESIIATGYNRLGSWDDEPPDPQADRFDQLDDMVNTTSQVFLGLTLGCARCHDHKFEPLTSEDYYSMVAVFDPLQRPQNGRTELTLPAVAPRQRAILPEKKKPGPTNYPPAYIFHEPSPQPPPTHLLIRGSPARPGPEVKPAAPAIVPGPPPLRPLPGEFTSGRRLALARWIAHTENPLTARIIVNRVWQQHMGVGLVRTPNDFGLMGDAPTHPELLDWLSYWFVHDAGWSLKKLHWLILTSRTFQMARATNPAYRAMDPDNLLWSHVPHRRLEVEALRDSVLAVSGMMVHSLYGPSMYPEVPAQALAGHSDPDKIWPPFNEAESSRRTIYAFVKRSLVLPMLEVLDLCDTTQSSGRRTTTTVAPQALTLFNGDFINRQARHFADRLEREAGSDKHAQLELAYRLALCRPPTATERARLIKFLHHERDALLGESPPAGMTRAIAENRALQQVCRTIFNLNEFAYTE